MFLVFGKRAEVSDQPLFIEFRARTDWSEKDQACIHDADWLLSSFESLWLERKASADSHATAYLRNVDKLYS